MATTRFLPPATQSRKLRRALAGLLLLTMVAGACASATEVVDSADPEPVVLAPSVEARPAVVAEVVEATEVASDPSPGLKDVEGAAVAEEIETEAIEAPAREAAAAESQPVNEAPKEEPELEPFDWTKKEFQPIPVDGGIEDVNFYSGFRYAFYEHGQVEVSGGFASHGQLENDDFYRLEVLQVAIGDLDHDGEDEAAVHTSRELPRDRRAQMVHVFEIEEGMLTHVGDVWAGDRRPNGLAVLQISDGYLTVRQPGFNSTGEPVTLIESTYRGADFLERRSPHRYVDLGHHTGAPELIFVPGQSKAAVQLSLGHTEQAFSFSAQAGQQIVVSVLDGRTSGIRLTNPQGVAIANIAPDTVVTLPTTAVYNAEVQFPDIASATSTSTSTLLEISIADPVYFDAPDWHPRAEHTEEDGISVRANWPEFEPRRYGLDADVANRIIGKIVTDAQARFYERAELLSEADIDASMGLAHSLDTLVTMVAPDLVSVRAAEWTNVCCDGSAEWSTRGITIDLAVGRELALSDIITVDQPDALSAVWLEAYEQQNPWVAESDLRLPDRVDVVGAFLNPSGVVLVAAKSDGVSAESLAERQVVDIDNNAISLRFADLEGLVHPTLEARVAAGAAVPLPVVDTCGC